MMQYMAGNRFQERVFGKINPLLKNRGVDPLTEKDINVYRSRVGDVCYGSGLDDALEILSKVGRKKDANWLVFSKFSTTGSNNYLWKPGNSFKNALKLFVEYGDRNLLPQISKIALDKGCEDFACMAAYESNDENLIKSLTDRRLEQLLRITPEDDVYSDNNAPLWAMKLSEKVKETKGLETIRDWFLANSSYHSALRPAGRKFKIDGRQSDLNWAAAFFAKEKFIRDAVISPEWREYRDILYEDSISEDEKTEDIGKFRRYWKDGKVERVQELGEGKNYYGGFFIGNTYRSLPDGIVEEESLRHYEDVGDGINYMPVMKNEPLEKVSAHLEKLLKGEKFETNEYMENMGGTLPHINTFILDPEADSFSITRKTTKDILESLPEEEYEKPVSFDIGGVNGMRLRIFTGVLDNGGEFIYSYPEIKGTIFDVGVKGDLEEYRLKIGVFSGNQVTNEILVGGTKSVLTNNLPAEAKEIRERVAGIRDKIENTFSKMFDESNFGLIRDTCELGIEFCEGSTEFSSFEDMMRYVAEKEGGIDAYRNRLKMVGYNDSLIEKMIECM